MTSDEIGPSTIEHFSQAVPTTPGSDHRISTLMRSVADSLDSFVEPIRVVDIVFHVADLDETPFFTVYFHRDEKPE